MGDSPNVYTGAMIRRLNDDDGKWKELAVYDRDIKALEDELLLSVFPDEDVMEVRGLRLKVAEQAKTIERLEEFVRNGIEYGYIDRPEEDDPACATIDWVMEDTQ